MVRHENASATDGATDSATAAAVGTATEGIDPVWVLRKRGWRKTNPAKGTKITEVASPGFHHRIERVKAHVRRHGAGGDR